MDVTWAVLSHVSVGPVVSVLCFDLVLLGLDLTWPWSWMSSEIGRVQSGGLGGYYISMFAVSTIRVCGSYKHWYEASKPESMR